MDMTLTRTRYFKVLICPLLFLGCFLILHESSRATATVLLLALVVSYIHFLRTSKTKWMRLIFVVFLIAAFIPIDVTLTNFPGPPRLVPLIRGTPNDEDVARARRGEVFLGGCIFRGNDPRWVWVW
jgi:hypothetical protein